MCFCFTSLVQTCSPVVVLVYLTCTLLAVFGGMLRKVRVTSLFLL